MSNITLADGSVPSSPTTGNVKLFIEDDLLKSIDDASVVTEYIGATAALTPEFILKAEAINTIGDAGDGVAGIFTDVNNNNITIRPITNDLASFKLFDSFGASAMFIQYNDAASQTTIATQNPLFIIAQSGDLVLESTTGTIDFLSSAGNLTPAFEYIAQGSGGGTYREFIGTVTPVGAVTGSPGDRYTQVQGVQSNLYIHTGASTDNTSWTATGGNVTTSDTLTNEFLLKGNGGVDINAATSDDVAGFFFDGALDELVARAAAGGTVGFGIQNSSGVTVSDWFFNDNTNTLDFNLIAATNNISATGPLVISSTGDTEITSTAGLVEIISAGIITTTVGPADQFLIQRVDDDLTELFRVIQGGTNGGNFRLLAGDRDPNGAVTGFPGSVYVRDDTTSSRMYFNAAAVSSTVWDLILTDTNGGVSTADILTNNFIVSGRGTETVGASTSDDVSGFFTDANGETAIIRLLSNSGGGFAVQSSAGGNKLDLLYDDLNDITDLFMTGATNNIGITGDLNISATGTASLTSAFIGFDDESTQVTAATEDGFGWNISTAIAKQTEAITFDVSPRGIWFREDGLKYYVGGASVTRVAEFNLSTAWDITTSSFVQFISVSGSVAALRDVFFRPDGLRMFTLDVIGNDVDRWDLTVPWDISTATQVNLFDVGGSDPIGMTFKPDGLAFYVADFTLDTISEFVLTTPWDVTTASAGSIFSTVSETVEPEDVAFKPDGKIMYVISDNTNKVFQYRLTTAWDISTAYYTGFDLDSVGATGEFSLQFKPDGTKLYILNDGPDQITEYDMGLVVEGNVTARGNNVATLMPTEIEVYQASDIDDLATAGVITISSPTLFDIKATNIVITSRFDFTSTGTALFRGADQSFSSILFSNAGALFSGFPAVDVRDVLFVAIAGGSIFDMSADFLSSTFPMGFRVSAFINFASLGNITNGRLIVNQCTFTGFSTGLTATNCAVIQNTNRFVSTTLTGSIFNISKTPSDVLNQFILSNVLIPSGASLLRIDPGVDGDANFLVRENDQGVGTLYDESGGSTGTFTAVADAAVASTTVNSVSDSSGFARFNFTVGPTLFVDQEITLVGYVTNTAYNVTRTIKATGAGFFELNEVPFGTDEAGGSFTSASVTLTDTTTTLSNGDTLVIDTDDATDYDNGATVYNQLTNSFQINRTFTVTQTGSWDTAGIGKRDKRVRSVGNPDFIDSKYIAFAEMNDNSTVTSITDGVYAAIDTTGLTVSFSTERFKLINAADGVFEYTGSEPFEGDIIVPLSAFKGGGTENYRFAPSINGAVPVFASASYTPMEVKTTKVQVTIVEDVSIVKGDTIQIMLAGDGTGDGLTVSDIKIGIR